MKKKGIKITFGTIRNFCSFADKISICIKETSAYENYNCIIDVPEKYNEYYLYGFGVIDMEFEYPFEKCTEIMISKEPRMINSLQR